jgi:hypothetical protein
VAQITRAVEAMTVSPLVLWGNVASAVNGATVMIAKARPDLAVHDEGGPGDRDGRARRPPSAARAWARVGTD